ncbi:MAG: ribosome recycling factor [Deltaproteobacteria bacterium]|nr:ribosome recycling factor [Deltaproteobacteria bacterium]
MVETLLKEMNDEMEKALHELQVSFSRVRTGRASTSLLDGLRVDYYGSQTPINQLANLSTPETRLIVISPWDTSAITAIEKAIQKSDLGLMPNSDGKVIRINIPVLTEERRKELVKLIKKGGEDSKIKIRNSRRDINEKLKLFKKDGKISEDQMFSYQENVQKKTDATIETVDKLVVLKEKEIMEI